MSHSSNYEQRLWRGTPSTRAWVSSWILTKYVDVIVRRRRGVSAKAALTWAGWQGLRPEARKARRSSAGAGQEGVRCYGLMR